VDDPIDAPGTSRHPELRNVAAGIVGDLCAAAVWDSTGSHCNWIGRQDSLDATPGVTASSAALGPDLYAGSTGIALFLADAVACRLDPDGNAAHTAAAALRRSARFHQRDAAPGMRISPLSFYAGHLGAAHVATRLMAVSADTDLDEVVDRLMKQVWAEPVADAPCDLIAGCAGAIPALLLLSREPDFSFCGDLAFRCGERLCEAAIWDGEDCAWAPAEGIASTSPLTGMAHGAAGPALALLELYAATGHTPFLRTARGGFSFEDSLFSPAAENWLDPRSPYSGERGERVGRSLVAWCHGAPGIALSRARATALDPERADTHEASVRRVMPTILAALSAQVELPNADASLCHGIAGLSEMVFTLGELLGEDGWTHTGTGVAQELAARHDPGTHWPSGLQAGGPHPGLLVGSAGIGHHFLRTAHPGALRSALLLTP
jgi:lantibiotic modifying enzyme